MQRKIEVEPTVIYNKPTTMFFESRDRKTKYGTLFIFNSYLFQKKMTMLICLDIQRNPVTTLLSFEQFTERGSLPGGAL